MKKTGIITIHNSTNFGANLQAYALNKYLNNIGCNTETIDYIQPVVSEHSMWFVCNLVLKNYIKLGLMPFIKTFLKMPFYIKEKKPVIKVFNDFRKHNLPMSKKYSFSNISRVKYDNIVIGSDQVWNPDITEGIDKVFFGQSYICNNIISYAASIGKNKYKEEYEEIIKRYLKSFKNISVREKKSEEYLSNLLNRKVELVCDPVFLIDREDYNKILTNSIVNKKEKYILIYTVINNDNVYKIANELQKKYSYKIIQLSNNKIDKNGIELVKGGPIEFLYLFKNAEFIVTNSFHGTAFSIIFEKEFYVIDNKERGTRITNLLELSGLRDRMVENTTNNFLTIDYFKVNKKLKPFIEDSQNYLKENLK